MTYSNSKDPDRTVIKKRYSCMSVIISFKFMLEFSGLVSYISTGSAEIILGSFHKIKVIQGLNLSFKG